MNAAPVTLLLSGQLVHSSGHGGSDQRSSHLEQLLLTVLKAEEEAEEVVVV